MYGDHAYAGKQEVMQLDKEFHDLTHPAVDSSFRSLVRPAPSRAVMDKTTSYHGIATVIVALLEG